jgi:hypothetical protein
MSAVILLQEDLMGQKLDGVKKKEERPRKGPDGKEKDPAKDRVGVLAIAYHNMGVE